MRLQENALAFQENVIGLPAQPGFAARIAEKPPHPAKGADDPGRYGIGERRQSNLIIWLMNVSGKTLPWLNPCSSF
jgi:hypothetical protein